MAQEIVVLVFVIYRLISTVGLTVGPTELLQLSKDGGAQFSLDSSDIARASVDFGGLSQVEPMAVMRPNSASDVVSLIRSAYHSAQGFPVSARGHGHSINGQASAPGGVVIDMSHSPAANPVSRSVPVYSPTLGGHYVDVWGGELWIDVLNWTLENGGLAPKSWTDYLYLSVGGTLSNAGISGQAFHHGPQISNVYELDVVTGKGEVVTCSEKENQDLFYGVLGGLGQFGIITRARIALEHAPKRVRWIRVLYSDFASFTRDQEHLISLHGSDKFDYVEGFVITDESLINNWRSSFFSPRNPIKLSSLGSHGKVLYCLELTKNYDDATAGTVDQEVEALLKELKFIPGTMFTTDLSYIDFLDRVHKAELKLRAKGLWEVPHPWLNLFVPASKIRNFDRGVFNGILDNRTSGPVLIYPMNKHKWDQRSSVVTPDEDVFYLVAFLRSAVPDSTELSQTLQYLTQQNERILEFCAGSGIEIKQYLPHYKTQAEWARHFGRKWARFVQRKSEFDPKSILAVGQRIFEPMGSHSSLVPLRETS
ncbi:cytokinin dehydrogenase 5-like protein [Carex littledalei]|uniref:cytokinin dehydrogenase n=1 Tax=Carex littledalei TaxID=544730 RepID=A0A833UYV8_9POAL|nr:cytokinin dehydrogenase 5-like protein [Carex littledalei]